MIINADDITIEDLDRLSLTCDIDCCVQYDSNGNRVISIIPRDEE